MRTLAAFLPWSFCISLAVLTGACSVAQAQIVDGSFESWHADSSKKPMLNNWQHMQGDYHFSGSTPHSSLYGTSRTDTAYDGNYAVTVSRWYNYTMDWLRQEHATTARPTGLAGWYRYTYNQLTGGSLDSALITIALTRWDGARRDTVGFGEVLLGAVDVYSPFTVHVTYTSALLPDTMITMIAPSFFGPSHGMAPGGWGSFLTVDDVSALFENGVDQAPTTPFAVYPNPVKDRLRLGLDNTEATVTLFDLLGQQALSANVERTSPIVDLHLLPAGRYVLVVRTPDGPARRTAIIKE